MILLLTGEGPTDIGSSATETACFRDNFLPGVMTHLVDQLLAPIFNGSPLEFALGPSCEDLVRFVPEAHLKHLEPRDPKKLRFNGRKGVQGTKFHFKYAEVLGNHARKIEAEKDEKVLAVFFRDADKTNSTPRTEWQEKWDSITSGFLSAGFERGVPMLPNPKSEAWILCALLKQYRDCAALENESGNDDSPNSLKSQLAAILNGREIEPGEIEVNRIDMPSFNAFKARLLDVAQSIEG